MNARKTELLLSLHRTWVDGLLPKELDELKVFLWDSVDNIIKYYTSSK